jgi:hypothetical protein
MPRSKPKSMDAFLERVATALHECAGRLTIVELEDHAPGKWSVADTLDHLARSFSATCRGLGRVMAAGTPRASPAAFRARAAAFLMIDGGYFPPGRKAPQVTLPIGIAPDDALRHALDNVRLMDEALARAAAQFGTRVKILDHLILGPLNIRQWRKFHWVHTRHHVRQIRQRTAGRVGGP